MKHLNREICPNLSKPLPQSGIGAPTNLRSNSADKNLRVRMRLLTIGSIAALLAWETTQAAQIARAAPLPRTATSDSLTLAAPAAARSLPEIVPSITPQATDALEVFSSRSSGSAASRPRWDLTIAQNPIPGVSSDLTSPAAVSEPASIAANSTLTATATEPGLGPLASNGSQLRQSQLSSPTTKATLLAQTSGFPDIQGNWAQPFIEGLANRGIVQGFPDGTFRPNQGITRAQFAAIVLKAFKITPIRQPITFEDVPPTYWAYEAIQTAYSAGFFEGYPNNLFEPEQKLPRTQALVSLASGLKLTAMTDINTVLQTYYRDSDAIPTYARAPIAGATESRIVVNYPDVTLLLPDQITTRADVAAYVYQALVKLGELPAITPGTLSSRYIVGPEVNATTQLPTKPASADAPSASTIQDLQTRLQGVEVTVEKFGNIYEGSPALSIANPVGYGADNFTGFVSGTYQQRTRFSDSDDGAIAFGIGLGDARKLVGVELSYTIASFGSNRDFGTGGFNVKVHRLISEDLAIAVGWNGFATINDTPFNRDFKNSIYGTVTKIFRIQENLDSPFSRAALTVGVGGGQFRTEEDVTSGSDSANVFSSLAIRVARPVSAIVEWTGQDLAAGLSIVPFRNFNFVITPAVRDIAGAGDGARFVLGAGFSFKF